MIEEKDWQITKEALRGNVVKYTRKAFQLLPNLDKPDILDIGCGSGIPTLELAALSNGQITALDNDQSQLDILAEKLKELGLDNRIIILNKSMTEMAFPARSFDIIWAEGSICVIGFENMLKRCRDFIKPGGFMVIHDDKSGLQKKLKLISSRGYKLIEYFILSNDVWWTEYYEPLERKIQAAIDKNLGNAKILAAFKKDLREIEMCKKNASGFSSVFFIIQKASD